METAPAEMIPPLSGPHWAGVAAATVLAFFAFVGFEDMANVAEEVKEPRHTLPRAIALTLVLATALYIATTVAVLIKVPQADLAGAAAPLALVFTDAPEIVGRGFSALAVVATINGVLIQMIMAARVIFGLADRGHLPSFFAQVSPRTRTPTFATFSVVAIILVLSQMVAIADLAEGTSQIVLVVFVLVNAALLRIKAKGEAATDHFTVPRLVPVFGILTGLALLVSSLL